jgi:flagellar motor switch protein FliM
MSDAAKLLRFAVEGERVRRAASALERVSPLLASGIRRAMPFLATRGASVALAYTRAMPIGDLLQDIARPIHATHVVATPAGGHGAIILDGGAIALILDGVLGGDGTALPTLDAAGLTTPQMALLSRVIDGVVKAFSEVLSKKFGLTLQPDNPDAEAAMTEGAPVACCLEFGSGTQVGRVILLLAKEALLGESESRETEKQQPLDARVAAVVGQVELEVVAELARVKMTLGRLSSLKAGDTIRLDVPVGGTVSVRAEGHTVLRGHPTTSAGQIAIRVAGGSESR